jgi:hypothetical protein
MLDFGEKLEMGRTKKDALVMAWMVVLSYTPSSPLRKSAIILKRNRFDRFSVLFGKDLSNIWTLWGPERVSFRIINFLASLISVVYFYS